ncbi:MAG: undecaprenyl-phosphate glucose phosphotransferase [Hydrogenovibrio sp.]
MFKAFLHPDKASFVWLHRFLDLAVTAVLFVWLFGSKMVLDSLWLAMFAMVSGMTFVVLAQVSGIYQNWRGRPFFASIKMVLVAWLWTWLLWLALMFVLSSWALWPKDMVLLWGALTPLVLMFYRLVIRRVLIVYRAHGGNSKNVVIVGRNALAESLAERVVHDAGLGYRLLRFYDSDPISGTEIQSDFYTNNLTRYDGTEPVIVPLQKANLKADIHRLKVDEVYLCLPVEQMTQIKSLLETLSDTSVVVKYVPDLFVFDLLHAKVTDISGIPVLGVFDSALTHPFAQFIKRVEDVVISVVALVVFAPLMLVLAFAVKVSSQGPVLFKQRRYGLNGREISVYKFRTMYCDACEDNPADLVQVRKRDPRVTPIGHILRRSSLDELPQFFNVIQGKMSVVGPRPHAVAQNEVYRKLVPKYMQRYLVKPGITGWAQVNGWRGETDSLDKMCKRVEFDLHYVRNWSLWFDVKIIVMTFYKGFLHQNAH